MAGEDTYTQREALVICPFILRMLLLGVGKLFGSN